MPTIASDPGVDELIERLARDDNGRFDRALGDALQERINAIECAEAARECIRRVAATAHARFPQYAGHWSGDEWQVGSSTTRRSRLRNASVFSSPRGPTSPTPSRSRKGT